MEPSDLSILVGQDIGALTALGCFPGIEQLTFAFGGEADLTFRQDGSAPGRVPPRIRTFTGERMKAKG
jgi:hypothetical protein